MFFCAALVLLFIIKLRFPKGKNIHQLILLLHWNINQLPMFLVDAPEPSISYDVYELAVKHCHLFKTLIK